ncbi:MAG TPA: YceI family protein [Patescibacteria group bacterium]|nr:YceI family protein [Patescibacteria group bacterium]
MQVQIARVVGLFIVALVAAGCGGAASVTVDATIAPAAATPSAATATTAAAALSWTVSASSKATVRVREQLASLNLPSDAVLVATGAKGAFQVNDDGTFAPGSQITFDVTSLASDQSQRDSFVKQSVLNTRQFPTATLVPTKATGLTLPLAASAHSTFTLTAKLTIHGTTKDVTFTVDCTRSGGDLVATATLAPTVKFGDFGMQPPVAPGRVLSVVDEIKLTVDLVATGPKS